MDPTRTILPSSLNLRLAPLVLYDMQIFLPFESVASPSPSGFEKQLKSSPTFRGAGARGIKLPFVFWDEEHFGGGDMI